MSLLTATPKAITFDPDGSVMLYYRAAPDTLGQLALGAAFGIVYSPSAYCPAFDFWRYVRFEVGLYKNIVRHVMERSYIQQSCRALTEEEIAHVYQLAEAAYDYQSDSAVRMLDSHSFPGENGALKAG